MNDNDETKYRLSATARAFMDGFGAGFAEDAEINSESDLTRAAAEACNSWHVSRPPPDPADVADEIRSMVRRVDPAQREAMAGLIGQIFDEALRALGWTRPTVEDTERTPIEAGACVTCGKSANACSGLHEARP